MKNSVEARKKPFFRKHPRITSAILLVLLCLLLLLGLEFTFVFGRFLLRGPESARHIVKKHPELGWTLNPEQREAIRTNRCGEQYTFKPPVDEFLLTEGEMDDRVRVLFIGDSTTHGHEVGTDNVYHTIFAQLASEKFSVFSAGVGGYGSVQEYLIFKKVYPRVKPQIVVWQVDANDPENNVYELDNAAIYNNQWPRPYLNPDTGQIQLKDPGFFLFDWSELALYLFAKVLVPLDWKYELGIVNWINEVRFPEGIDSMQGFRVLEYVLSRIKREYSALVVIGMNDGKLYDSKFEEAFRKSGHYYISNFGTQLEEKSGGRNYNCAPLDFHWNIHGNQLAGQLLDMHISNIARRESLIQ